MLVSSKIEYDVDIIDNDVAIIAKRLVEKYKGQAIIRGGSDKKESWIVVYTIDEDEFQDFLHNEFLKLIPVLEVVKDNFVNILSWPTNKTEVVLNTIKIADAVTI